MRNPSCSSSNYGFIPKKATTTPCCSKIGIKRGPWTPEEDELLSKYVNKEGEGRWRTLPKRAGLLRCGKSCRLRWMNYLRPSVKRGRIAPDEEDLILRLHRLLGNRWSLIAGRIPGRTDNEIKNYWNTHLSKKLIREGIDPRTHKPLNPNPSSSQNTQVLDQNIGLKFSHFEEINQPRVIRATKVIENFNMGNDLNHDHHHNEFQNIPIVNHDGVVDNWAVPSYNNDVQGQNNGDNFYVASDQNQNHEDHFSLFLDSLINENENLFLNQNHHFLQQEQQQQQQLQLQLQREQEQQNPNLLASITQSAMVSTQKAFINNSINWETDLLSSVSAALDDEDVALN